MGVSFSNLVEPHNHSQAQSIKANCCKQTCAPQYPGRSNNKLELVPTCDHDMLHSYQDIVGPRLINRGIGSFGNGFGPQRRPRFGFDGWDGGPGFCHGGRPDRLCGYCGEPAHSGLCDDGGPRGSGWSRPRYMRGGGGRAEIGGGDIAAGLNTLSAALNNTAATGGGCGPTCSANDGGIRVRGTVGDHDVDLKLGGKQKCPCDEDGGCELSYKRAKSRSRSRKRRERRGRRRARRREQEIDGDSTEGEQSRGRTRVRVPLRGGDGSFPDLQPRLERLETNVEKLNNGWVWVKSRVPDLPPPFPGKPDLGLPDGSPFDVPTYAMGRAELGDPPMRPGLRQRMRTMGDLSDIDELRLPPRLGVSQRPAGTGRIPRQPRDVNMDPLLDGPDLELRGGLGARRYRPQIDREDELGVADHGGFEDVEEDLPVRLQRSLNLNLCRPRGFRGRPRGLPNRRGGLRTARDEAERRRDEEMFGGLRTAGENDDANWELPRRPGFAARTSFPLPHMQQDTDRPTNGRKARAESTQDSPGLGERNRSRQSGGHGEKPISGSA